MKLDIILGQLLMRVRPAPLAVLLKKMLFIKRRPFDSVEGRFWIDPASQFGQTLARQHIYDAPMLRALDTLLNPGDCFIDSGANEGYFSVVAARRVGPSGRVIAIEPQSRLASVLRRNFAFNTVDWVEHRAEVISNAIGTTELFLSPDVNTGSTGLTTATSYRVAHESVPSITLDALLRNLDLPRAPVIKMDIESWEYEAILGSPGVFRERRVRALLLELHANLLRRRGLDPARLIACLHEQGYRNDADPHGLLWLPIL
jgi:FkbM family methyltransferase